MKRWASSSTPLSWSMSSRRLRSRRMRRSNRWNTHLLRRIEETLEPEPVASEPGETTPGMPFAEQSQPSSTHIDTTTPLAASPASAAPAVRVQTPGRIVPPTLRLRIRGAAAQHDATAAAQPEPAYGAASGRPSAGAPGSAKPGCSPRGCDSNRRTGCSSPGDSRSAGASAAPASARPPFPGTAGQRPPVGGPRPLPSAPIRPAQPGGAARARVSIRSARACSSARRSAVRREVHARLRVRGAMSVLWLPTPRWHRRR